MIDRNDNTFRLFEHYYTRSSERVIDQVYIGDFETVFILDNGDKTLFDELEKSIRFIPSLSAEQNELTEEQWLKEFSRKIKNKIKLKRFTQMELADELGISRMSISRYVNGKRVPDYLLLKRFAKVLNCPLEEITDFWYLL